MAFGTIESVLPHCDVRSACIHHNQSHYPDTGPTRLNSKSTMPDTVLLVGSAANTNFRVLGLTRPGIEPRTSRSLSECLDVRPQGRSNGVRKKVL
ncbi:hypothetical protein ElyMa_005721900 [Elysia marginata]|uniref:Sema domain-containing protein n=1 Tax=Elysia marginata TaxID=1093978 RepID=A0AAV4FJU5_9GAST|nr:hypothetical protein ElyMa_005721900 [Elysia marginata]